MKFDKEKIEISKDQVIPWAEVKTLRLLNQKLALVLSSGEVIELGDLRPSTIDTAFRVYEDYLRHHQEVHKKVSPKRRKKIR